jgi:Rrf2 family transcriptional regulator, iron-sulfur cluster assembly transcription factor
MKLSTKARYAVMAMTDLVMKGGSSAPCALAAIAERQELPLAYLEQIFVKLRKHNLVISVRGAAGGYVLGRSPETITIYDIIAAVDQPLKATRCKEKSPTGCQKKGARCMTHDLWEGLGFVVEQYLKNITLASILENNRTIFFEGRQAC